MTNSHSSPIPVMRVFIVRHGETNENRQGIIQGQMDTVLNDEGIFQAHLCSEALKDIEFDIAFSSDLKRASQTAEVILSRHPNTPLFKDQLLRERNMGELSGVKVGQYDKKKLPKSVETGKEFTRRTLDWWTHAVEQQLPTLPVKQRPYNALIVSHGAYIATLCRELVVTKRIDTAPNLAFGTIFNTSTTTIAIRGDKRGTLEKYADISHLVKPAVATNADEIPAAKVEDTNNTITKTSDTTVELQEVPIENGREQ